MPDRTWVSVHAFHQGDQDALLTEAAVPAVARLVAAGAATRWFYLRYWDGGPHVRVRVLAAPGRAAEVDAALTAELGAWLREHPSTPRLTAERYAALAAGLAQHEERNGYEPELRPADSVAAIAYRPERHVYGRGTALAAAEQHFTESTRIAVDTLIAGVPLARRRGMALSAALLTLADLAPDLDRFAGGLAANVESIRAVGERAGMPDLSASYERQRGRLHEQVRQLWALAGDRGDHQHHTGHPDRGDGDAGGADGDADGWLTMWLTSARALRTRLEDAAGRGELDVDPPRSPLSPALPVAGGRDPVILGIGLRCAHLLNNRLGLTLGDELHVNYLISRVLGDLGRVSRAAAAGLVG